MSKQPAAHSCNPNNYSPNNYSRHPVQGEWGEDKVSRADCADGQSGTLGFHCIYRIKSTANA
jgi:hypothetical protein